MMLDNATITFDEALGSYLGNTLHERVTIAEFPAPASLPSFLGRTYSLYQGRIAGRRCVFLAARNTAATPAEIAKHVSLVRQAVDAVVVFATPSLSAHNRSRLIGHGVPFAVPGNQLYVPDLAIDLREHFRSARRRKADSLSPAAQAVLFQHLLRQDRNANTPSLIAAQLGYSAMSVGRAFDNLVSAGLAHTGKHGKERHIRFKAEGRPLFEAARDLLRSPVRSVKFVRGDQFRAPLKQAGESALARLTELSPPPIDTFAVASIDWKTVARTFDLVEASRDQADFAVETWSYDPASLSGTDTVDPLSLYAQFRNHGDERVAMAADHLLETIPW